MEPDDPLSRRRVIQLSGVVGGAVLLAGCPDAGPDDGQTDDTPADDEEPANGEDPADEADPDEEDPDEEDPDEEDPDEEEADPDEGDEEADPDEENEDDEESGDTIEPGTAIELEGRISNWVGIEPTEIDGEENPTLVLEEDESYELGWTEGDGASHNLEIVDENDDVVDDLETSQTSSPGDDQWLEFEATDEMYEYVCRPHSGTMRGQIEVE